MCGYCIENNAFVMIARVQSGSEQFSDFLQDHLGTIGYLQNCPDIHAILAAMPTDVATPDLIPSIIACRGMEILMSQGFTSDAYQKLLKTPACWRAPKVDHLEVDVRV